MKKIKVFIIAEAGVNHNGSLSIAKKMVDAAYDSGADAIKFQTFKSENFISMSAKKAAYQKKTTPTDETQLEMVKKLELDKSAFRELKDCCRKKSLIFISTPFDDESIDFLADLGVDIFKIPSGEITNLPYLKKIGSLKKKVILSTGMSDLDEIRSALDILTNAGTPKNDITVLHCTTAYPAPLKDIHLRAMLTIKETFDVNIGYSDHTLGAEVSIAAVALGATVIEKHFTLNRNMEGPDHKASLEPHELKVMVRAIRNIEKAMGSARKKPESSELGNRALVRKSIVAAKHIKKGEFFEAKNIIAKRPGLGISPMEWEKIIGKIAKRDFLPDELIEL